jgi:Putative Actinobacterial Holin-X, holin superfamily III/Protein of unknown function (DUF3618)
MEDTATARPATAEGSLTAELVKHLSEQIGRLARDEVRLAELEMMRAGKRAGLGIGMFSGGGLLALYGLGCLLAAAIIGLAAAVAAWLAALIIGAGLLAAAGIAALAGRAELRKATTPDPDGVVDSVRGRRRGKQGAGTPMTESGLTPADPGPGDAPPDGIQALTVEINRTREDVGETVAALAAKADVKARGAGEGERGRRGLRDTADKVKDQLAVPQ